MRGLDESELGGQSPGELLGIGREVDGKKKARSLRVRIEQLVAHPVGFLRQAMHLLDPALADDRDDDFARLEAGADRLGKLRPGGQALFVLVVEGAIAQRLEKVVDATGGLVAFTTAIADEYVHMLGRCDRWTSAPRWASVRDTAVPFIDALRTSYANRLIVFARPGMRTRRAVVGSVTIGSRVAKPYPTFVIARGR